jgi:hypothetical protein
MLQAIVSFEMYKEAQEEAPSRCKLAYRPIRSQTRGDGLSVPDEGTPAGVGESAGAGSGVGSGAGVSTGAGAATGAAVLAG